MDAQQLVAALGACMSPDDATRKAAEEALKQNKFAPGHLSGLLRIALDSSAPVPVCQSAAISFKNVVKTHWAPQEQGHPSPLPGSDCAAVRGSLLQALALSPPPIRAQLLEASRTIAHADFPGGWAELPAQLEAALRSGELAGVQAALGLLRCVVRRYEFRSEDRERRELEEVVSRLFGPVHALCVQALGSLTAAEAPEVRSQAAQVLRLALKCYWSATYMSVPAPLASRDSASAWLGCARAVLERAREPLGEAPGAEPQEAWAKAQKWALHVTGRALRRHCRVGPESEVEEETRADREYAQHVSRDWATPLLSAVLALLDARARGAVALSQRVIALSFNVCAAGLDVKQTWRELKPHVASLVISVALPLLELQDEDLELWEEDAPEFVRRNADLTEDTHLPRAAAASFLLDAARARGGGVLDAVAARVTEVLAEYRASAEAADAAGKRVEVPAAVASRMYGACLALGNLADLLDSKKKYRRALEPMLLQHVLPLFDAAEGPLRARAAWLAGAFAEARFAGGAGAGTAFAALMRRVVEGLQDGELGVRLEAAAAMRRFLDAAEEDSLGWLRPALPQLLQVLLALAHESESEDVTYTLEILVERFAEDVPPYALGLVQHLVAQFWRVAGAEQQVAQGSGEEDRLELGPDSLAGYGILRTLSVILDAVSDMPALFPPLEEALLPLLSRFLCPEGFDVLEEMCHLACYLTYSGAAISPHLWTLYPALLEALASWGADCADELLVPLDNFISKGTAHFLSPSSGLLALTNAALERIFASRDVAFDALAVAAKLMSVVVQHCANRVDECVAPYVILLAGRLAPVAAGEAGKADPGAPPPEEDDLDTSTPDLLLALADLLHYAPVRTLQAAAARGAVPPLVEALHEAVGDVRPSGTLRRFPSRRAKKQLALGLVALLGAPAAELGPELAGLREGVAGVLLEDLLRVLRALREQEGKACAAESGEAGVAQQAKRGAEEDEDDSEDEGDEEEEGPRRRWEEDSDDYDSEDWDDEADAEAVTSPLDALDAFALFARMLTSVQHAEPERAKMLWDGARPEAQAAIQELVALGQNRDGQA